MEHDLDLHAEAQKSYLKREINCDSKTMKDATNCFCGSVSLACCKDKTLCTGDVKKACSVKVEKTCDDEITKAMKYYEAETEAMGNIYCSNDKLAATANCLCGNFKMACCKSKDKCESKYLGISRVCSEKTTDLEACNKVVDVEAAKKAPKPWFYKRLDFDSAALFMVSLLQLLALFTILAIF